MPSPGLAEGQARTNPKMAIAMLLALVIVGSAVMNNTPVVVVMIPVFVQIARTLGITASRLLIPLSYAAILGGTLTLIGHLDQPSGGRGGAGRGAGAFSRFSRSRRWPSCW